MHRTRPMYVPEHLGRMNLSTGTNGPASRRDALKLGIGLAGLSVAGCDLLRTDPAGEGTNDSPDSRHARSKEAPGLTELVEQSKLPPLEERLPAQPMVLEPLEELGQYGGELHVMLIRGQEVRVVNHTIAYEQLLRWQPFADQLSKDNIIANVAASFETGAEGAEYTFKLREGMRWSDGEPFTADDIVFWYEDVLGNEELTPQLPTWLVGGHDDTLVVEKLDDYSVIFRFSTPNGLFALNVASQQGGPPTRFPAHYLRQFHPTYNDHVQQDAEDADLDDWTDLFTSKADFLANPDLPVLDAWTLTDAVGSEGQVIVAERNPYYWKTDPDGKQLPYIDRVVYTIAENVESAVLKVTNGEIDVVARDINQLANKPVYARYREEGGYHFIDTIPQQMNQMLVHVNLTHRDPVLREIFRTKEFRIGLSHAINRQEIIDVVFQRQGEPWQAAPRPESPYYHERLATQYTEYDPGLANQYLDQVLPDKNSNGTRLRPDGSSLRFQIDVSTAWPDMISSLELIREQWREVGVEVGIRSEEGNLFGTRIAANEHDAAADLGHNGLAIALEPTDYMPSNLNSRYAPLWVYWYLDSDDERAEEPPAETKKQIELFLRVRSTVDEAEQDELINEIVDIAAERFYTMGVALRNREYGVISNQLRNTPKLSIVGFHHADLMPTNPQQYFFAD